MERKAKVGMIGLRGYGNIVRGGLKQCHKLELAAIWSNSADSVQRSQQELPSKVCPSYEALLAEPIDAVLIINPNYLHVEYALPAAAAHKAILVEKPMTNTVAEAKKMIAAFRQSHVLLGVKHLARFAPVSRKIKSLVEGGALGKVLSVDMYTSHSTSKKFAPDRWKREFDKCPAAPLTQLGVHHIDTVMSFLGKPDWVQSHHRNVLGLSGNVDCTVSLFGFGEVVATLTAHYVVPSYNRLAVYGSEGVLVSDEMGLRVKREGAEKFEILDVPAGDGMVEILDAFGESLLTGQPFETDGDSSIYVVAAAEAAINSSLDNGRRVSIADVLKSA